MKNIFIITTLIIVSSCTKGLITEKQKNGNIMFEKFDFIKWEKENFQFKKHEYSDSYMLKDGSEVYVSDEELYILPSKPLFYVEYKGFYNNGFIKQKGKYFGKFDVNSNSIKIGIWYEFDEIGNFTKQSDEDTKFGAFSYNDILSFLDKKEEISLHTGKNRENLDIKYYYSENTKAKLWVIFIKIGEPIQIPGEGYRIEQKGKGYYLDGNTGEIIQRKDLVNYKSIISDFDKIYPDLK